MTSPILLDNRNGNKRHGIFEQAGSALPAKVKASDAFTFFGEYEPILANASYTINGQVYESNTRGIFLPDRRGKLTEIGTVKGKYQPVTPKAFCKLWDDNVGLHISAMGIKGIGEEFYIASDLGLVNVNGSEVRMYLLGTSPMTGKGSIQVRVTPVNMWCTNQLQASRRKAVINCAVTHNAQVFEKTATWLKHLKAKAEHAQKQVQADFKSMMQTPLTEAIVTNFVDTVYTLPEEPNQHTPASLLEDALKKWENEKRLVGIKRSTFRDLLEGGMTGHDLHGDNVYKLFNAHAELVQYGRTKGDNAALSSLMGKRSDDIEYGYDRAMSIVEAVQSGIEL